MPVDRSGQCDQSVGYDRDRRAANSLVMYDHDSYSYVYLGCNWKRAAGGFGLRAVL
jgi:hypothetical protein